MKNNCLIIAKLILPTAFFSLVSLLFPAGAMGDYIQQNLTSSQPGLAQNTDLSLKNPWGISYTPTGPFWVSNNQTATSTLYNGAGTLQALVVTIPTHDFQPTGGFDRKRSEPLRPQGVP